MVWTIRGCCLVMLAASVAVTQFGFSDEPAEEGAARSQTLSDDGRIGRVVDLQGIVAVRPAMAMRFTPVCEPVVLKPGDWLRTDPRGANAVALRLVGGAHLTLGPGTVVELSGVREVRLSAGEVQVAADAATPVTVVGPDHHKIEVRSTEIYRVQDGRLVHVEAKPVWLQGFEGTLATESIGSLVVNVEGRNVPLTVGYHKVTVDIRDQIARTVIEQSFVNRTRGRLEGVFYFPLPQDASISGFGMWIGNELVEADIVEKQRAREIYETILRERRDPGLLEWSGGNLFKARVFPIEPLSEKRVKITYTQVLPLRGRSYRYTYPLQSELLKQHPLRELAIDVRIHSVLPLASVRCPTHLARIDRTAHSGRVEFTAQEFTPERDFEVVVDVDARRSEVVAIPHRRGEDGYFMLMLLPPGGDGDWQRETLPDGQALELLILADTSASLDPGARRAQADFVAALLGGLTTKDRFNLAGFDVDCDWVFDDFVGADEKHVAAARAFLDDRHSLGWTDLDRAVESALHRAGPQTHVIYVGDGIPVTADSDPVTAAQRLRRSYDASGSEAAFHAVSVGSRYESVVLRAMASLGGGSMRQITGEQGPAKVALETLAELIRPAVRDLMVEFRGLRTARVYPDQLPNLAPGTQHILLGRYLPEGTDQQGEVVVTGVEQGRPVRFHAPIALADAESGNSFIPRLWARMHLDYLLQQGPSEPIRQEIIALSEEYHIITPYTSLLVLETDADRERFGVQRRFLMRDGEKFFAEGRDAADYELVQQQMRRAGNWRLGLRRMVLLELAGLAREPALAGIEQHGGRGYGQAYGGMGGMGGFGGDGFAGGSWRGSAARPMSGPLAEFLPRSRLRGLEEPAEPGDASLRLDGASIDDVSGPDDFSYAVDSELGESLAMDIAVSGEGYDWDADEIFEAEALWSESPAASERFARTLSSIAPQRLSSESDRRRLSMPMNRLSGLAPVGARGEFGRFGYDAYYVDPSQYIRWFDALFPHLADAPLEPPADETPHPWPAEARNLARSLLRTEAFQTIPGGLYVERRSENFEPRSAEPIGLYDTLSLVAPDAWVIRSSGGSSGGAAQTMVQWCDRQQRGVFGLGFRLGRVRDSSPADRAKPPLELSGPLFTPLDQSYRQYDVELRQPTAARTLLVLTTPGNPDHQIRFLIDTDRHVVLAMEVRQGGKLASLTKFDDFVEVLDAWWATRIETTDSQGRRTALVRQTFQPLSAEAIAERMADELAACDDVQLVREPLPIVARAKQAIADGKAEYSDRLAMVLHFARSQQWTRVIEHLDAAEKVAGDRPGGRFVRDAILHVGRRHEELKARIGSEADELARLHADRAANGGPKDRLFLAEYLLGQASGVLEANEMLALLDALRPVYHDSPDHLQAMKRWMQQRVNHLRQTGRAAEALELRRQLAEQYPRDFRVQQSYAQALFNAGEHESGYAWLERVLVSDFDWLPHEENALRGAYAQQLRNEGRFPEMLEFLEDWIAGNPENSDPYARYLSTLVRVDREERANRQIKRWLDDGRQPDRIAPDVAARLQAAVNQALGRGHELYTDRIDERWHQPLAGTALFLAEHPTQSHVADLIVGDRLYRQTDACRRVRAESLRRLEDGIGDLPPPVVRRYVD